MAWLDNRLAAIDRHLLEASDVVLGPAGLLLRDSLVLSRAPSEPVSSGPALRSVAEPTSKKSNSRNRKPAAVVQSPIVFPVPDPSID